MLPVCLLCSLLGQTGTYSVFSARKPVVCFGQADLLGSQWSLCPPQLPCGEEWKPLFPKSALQEKEVGKQGPPILNWGTGPEIKSSKCVPPGSMLAHIAGQVAMVTPLPASFSHPGRKPATLGWAKSEQIASWSKIGSYFFIEVDSPVYLPHPFPLLNFF